ncbi:MAG: hypothetical protein U0270_46425 [Labilithrix sp.]
MRDLLGDERREKISEAPTVFLCARDEIAQDAARASEVKTLQQIVDGNVHVRVSC